MQNEGQKTAGRVVAAKKEAAPARTTPLVFRP